MTSRRDSCSLGTCTCPSRQSWPRNTRSSSSGSRTACSCSLHRQNQRYTEITHEPLPFSVAQGIFWLSWERLLRSTLLERRERSLYSFTILAVPRWLNNCCIVQIFSLLCRQGSLIFPLLCRQVSLLLIETVQCTTTPCTHYTWQFLL
jgi:hypothetical protein